MKSKVLALLCAAAMSFALAACGAAGSSAAPAETQSVQDAAASAPQEAPSSAEAAMSSAESAASVSMEPEPAETPVPVALPLVDAVTTMTYWVPMPPADSKGVRPDAVSFNPYMLEQTNVQFDFVGPPANAAGEQFSIMIASNDYPDWIEKFGTFYTAGYESAIEQDIILDVSDLIETYMPNYLQALNATPQRRIAVTTDNGCIPGFTSFYLDPADDSQVNATYGTIIRRDWLSELGLDSPKTYEDYHTVLQAFRDQYGATMWLPYGGFVANNVFISGFDTAGFQYGSTTPFYVDGSGTVQYGPLSDGYYDYLAMMADWYQEGLIYPDFPSGTDIQNADYNLYADGTVGVFFCYNRAYSSLKTAFPEIDFAPAANPVKAEGQPVHIGTPVSANGISVVLSTMCDDPELAAKLVDWMYTPDASFHARYGFAGEAYEPDASGEPVFTELVTNNPDGREPVEALAAYSINYFVRPADPAIEAALQGQAMTELYDIWGAQDGSDWNYPATVTMTETESADFSAAYSDISTHVSEQALRWIVGEDPLTEESFAAFRDSLTNMGIDACIAGKQSAYDRYTQRGTAHE